MRIEVTTPVLVVLLALLAVLVASPKPATRPVSTTIPHPPRRTAAERIARADQEVREGVSNVFATRR